MSHERCTDIRTRAHAQLGSRDQYHQWYSAVSIFTILYGLLAISLSPESYDACGILAFQWSFGSAHVLYSKTAFVCTQSTILPLFEIVQNNIRDWMDNFIIHASPEGILITYLGELITKYKNHKPLLVMKALISYKNGEMNRLCKTAYRTQWSWLFEARPRPMWAHRCIREILFQCDNVKAQNRQCKENTGRSSRNPGCPGVEF